MSFPASPNAHASVGGATNTGTTAAIDTTGCNLIVIGVTWYNGFTAGVPTITDSKSNTWTQIGSSQSDGNVTSSALFYSANPTVGTGHTFTWTNGAGGTGQFATLTVEAWSGAASSPLDQTNQGSGTSPFAVGSVTPGQSNELLVTVGGADNGSSVSSINSSFTISDNVAWSSGLDEGSALAYLVQTTATAVNPTWTLSGSVAGAGVIATFKPSTGAAVPDTLGSQIFRQRQPAWR